MSAGEPLNFIAAIRAQVLAVDREQPVYNVRALAQIVTASIADRRFTTALLGVFAALALTLAAVGIYGVISFSVAQRAHEIGIRMALGAERRDVLRLVVAQGMRLALFGVALGLVGALGLTRWLRTLLYEVSATDPLTFLAVAGLLLAVALTATLVPAQRATKVDPLVALKGE